MLLLALPFGILIGLIVGAVGGGGAILGLPVLVYVLGEGVGPATTASLVVVAFAAGAAVGISALAHHGQVDWRVAGAFGLPAAAGSPLGAIANGHVSGSLLILTFVPVMLVAATATWQRACGVDATRKGPPPAGRLWRAAAAGLAVGVLTGFFGVGGGFLIVPVLTLGLGIELRRAIATSLVIVGVTALAALTSHLAAGASLDVPVTASLSGATVVGALIGTAGRRRLPREALARGFAVLVYVVAVFLLVDTLLLGGPPGG